MTDLADRGAGAVDDTDAVDLILADHEEMERLLRLLGSVDVLLETSSGSS